MGKFAISKTQHHKIVVGSVVLVTFPFSNLKGQKVRPALVLSNVEFNNFILCQITSKPYTSKISIRLKQTDFASGGLPIVSYVRPDKLFTADKTIIKGEAGQLTLATKQVILKSVCKLFTA